MCKTLYHLHSPLSTLNSDFRLICPPSYENLFFSLWGLVKKRKIVYNKGWKNALLIEGG